MSLIVVWCTSRSLNQILLSINEQIASQAGAKENPIDMVSVGVKERRE
jgi:hypothetical protein